MANTTKLNDYVEEFREKIENLSSVRVCDLYGGELDTDDISKIKVDLRVPGQTHVFLDIAGMTFVRDKVHCKVYADVNIQAYVCGVFDRRTKGHSFDCANTISEIINLVNLEARTTGLKSQPQYTNLGESGQLANAIRENQRYSIWYVNFIQRITIE